MTMEKPEAERRLEKLLKKKLAFNRLEIQFNDKSVIFEYPTPKKTVEQAIAYLFKIIEYFKFTGSILNVDSPKYRSIDIKRYFAHPMLRSELWNIELNHLKYGKTIKYGGRVYIEIGPSELKGRLLIKTKTAWNKDDMKNTLTSLGETNKLKIHPKILKKLNEIIDEKIALSQRLREIKREEFLEKRKTELEQKIQEEKKKLARLEEQERLKEEKQKTKKMREWRRKNKLYPIADLASINWDKRWMDDFDIMTDGITNVKIDSLEDEEYLRDYCDQIIDFIINLDVYTIRSDPDIKNMMMRRIHESKKLAIMKLMEPELVEKPGLSIESSLQELIAQLPQTPVGTVVTPKPVPLQEEEEESKEKEQKEVPLFD